MAIETGLSDCHKMTVTVMKSRYENPKPKIISYRRYKNFSNDAFRENLIEQIDIQNFQHMTLDTLKQLFLNILEKFAPVKHK